MNASHRVIFNTFITYSKAVVTAIASLYGTRLVLQVLGAEDFGLYNLIAGLIAMLAFLNAAMSTATQRYISVGLGKGDINAIKRVFANSIVIHFIIGLLLVLFIEVAAMYMIDNKLHIDPSRIDIAKYILHFTVASTFLTIISVPYDAVINAHENMGFLALVSILESLLRLGIAFVIAYVPGDKLFYYGLFMMTVAVLIRLIKRWYSKTKYEECDISIKKWVNRDGIAELTSFASWNLFGALCALGRNQGIAIVLSMFYSTVVNAAYGIANQLNGQLMFFSQTMMSAMRPQILKSEGANNRERMISLSLSANRLSFFLFTFFSIPLFFQMSFILDFWLKDPPKYSVEFCRAILLLTMANQINMGLMTAVQAIGKIKLYQVIAGGIQLLTLPIGYFLLKQGFPPHYVVLTSFLLECISTIFRVFYFKHLTGYSKKQYLNEVIVKSIVTIVPATIATYLISKYMGESWLTFMTVCSSSFLVYGATIFFFGLNTKEREIINGVYIKVKSKFK